MWERVTIGLGLLSLVIGLAGGFRWLWNEWCSWRHRGRWLALVCCLLPSIAQAEVFYIGESSAGANDGSSCANQKAGSFFNTAGNWGAGAGKISAGDTAYLCGTIRFSVVSSGTRILATQGNGSAGNVITVSPAPGTVATLNCEGSIQCIGFGFFHAYIVLDGVTGNKTAGDTNYGIVVQNIASNGGTASYCVHSDGNRNNKILHVDCSGSTDSTPDQDTSGIYVHTASGDTTQGTWEIAYNYIHSSIAPVAISTITSTGTSPAVTATVTTATAHNGTGYYGVVDGSLTSGPAGCPTGGYYGTRWDSTSTGANTLTFSRGRLTDGAQDCMATGLGTNTGGLLIWYWRTTGITAYVSDGTTNFNDTDLHHNYLEYLNHDGIKCGSQCSIHDNIVRHIEGSGHSDSLIIQSGSYGAIYNNYVEKSGDQNIYIDNLLAANCDHLRIYNNVLNSNPGIGIVLDAESGGAAASSTSCTGGVTGEDDIVMVNNTFATLSGIGIHKGRGAITNIVIKNNIFSLPIGGNTATATFNSTDATFLDANAWDYNVYEGSGSTILGNIGGSNRTLSQLQALSPARETNGHLGVPTYVDVANANYHLASSDTVARGMGTNIGGTYSYTLTDKDGVTRTTWDLGAYQFANITPPPAPTNLVIGRMLRWVEVLLPIAGLSWHFRRAIVMATIACLSCAMTTLPSLTTRTTTKLQQISYTSAVKIVTAFNRLTGPKG